MLVSYFFLFAYVIAVCFVKTSDLFSEDKFGVAYALLAKQAARSGDLHWILRPKIHAARHDCARHICT